MLSAKLSKQSSVVDGHCTQSHGCAREQRPLESARFTSAQVALTVILVLGDEGQPFVRIQYNGSPQRGGSPQKKKGAWN